MEVVIYPIGNLLEVSDLGFTSVEVVIYPENLNHAAQGRMVTCGLLRVLYFGFTAVEVAFLSEFYSGSLFFFRLVFLVLGW